MQVIPTKLPELLVIEPRAFPDARGQFFESWQQDRYAEAGIVGPFVQDNLSHSVQGTLRGLHFQEPYAQGKLLTVLAGRIFDVAVDIRRGSPTFGQWVGMTLDAAQPSQIWIPPGFAHGFCVLSNSADVMYKCTEYYRPEYERSIRWDDSTIAIDWPIVDPLLSEKDAAAPLLSDLSVLPDYHVS